MKSPMYHITLSEEIKRLCPAFQGVAVMAQVTNSAHNAELWREIDAFTRELRAGETAESIKQQPAIAATREAYKRCGKDPSRYRPSAESQPKLSQMWSGQGESTKRAAPSFTSMWTV